MLSNLTIRFKLNANLILIIIGLVIASALSYSVLTSLYSEYKHSSQIAKKTDYLKSIFIGGLLYNSSSGVVFQNPNSQKAKNTMSVAIKKVDTFFNKIAKLDKNLSNDLKPKVDTFRDVAFAMHQKAISGQKLQKADMKKSLKNWRALKFTLTKNLRVFKKQSEESAKNYDSMINNTITYLLISIVIGALIVIALNLAIIRSILSPLEVLQNAMRSLTDNTNSNSKKIDNVANDETGQIANCFNKYIDQIEAQAIEDDKVIKEVNDVVENIKKGILTSRVNKSTSNRSIMELVNSLNSMLVNLYDVVEHSLDVFKKYENQNFTAKTNINCEGEILKLMNGIDALGDEISGMLVDNKSRGLTLQNSSNELLANVNKLNTSSNEAAASLEETAAALEEVTGNVDLNTKNVLQMAKYANEVINSAKHGQDLSTQTDKAMDEINTEVASINEAITVIDQIAFQTNILSLNAAVEAATAGEAGKGFAVVAQEVRNLASRSAEAANEIKKIVENATIKANNGKDVAFQMTQGYEKLYENINNTIDLISNVEDASKEQQTSIVQINDAINSLDQQTQQNANTAAHTSTIAQQTNAIADEIVEDADNKEFIGKNNVKAKILESAPKKELSVPTQTVAKKVQATPSQKNSTKIKPIQSSSNDDDEWANF